MPQPKTHRNPQILSRQQQKLLLNTLQQAENRRDAMLIFLVLKTGLKSAEVCGLNVADVWQESQVVETLQVRPEIATNGIARHLPLSRDVQNAITDFIQWKKGRGESLQSSAPLFCTACTKKRLAPRDLQRMMEKACAGLDGQFTPNDLRHTFATALYQETGNVESVRVALGLSSLKPEQAAMYTRSSESAAAIGSRYGEKERDVEIIEPKVGVWRTYDVTNGLPGGVRCMLQDHQGYLWLATQAGLCRYDGVEFLTYTVPTG